MAPRKAPRKPYAYVRCARAKADPTSCSMGSRRFRANDLTAALIGKLSALVAMSDAAKRFYVVEQRNVSDRVSTTLAALADPTRRAILARLASGETSVTELAEPFNMTLPAVSKHLKVLERAGLIVRGRSAQ